MRSGYVPRKRTKADMRFAFTMWLVNATDRALDEHADSQVRASGMRESEARTMVLAEKFRRSNRDA